MNGQWASMFVVAVTLSTTCFGHPMHGAMRSGRISRWRPFNVVDPAVLPLRIGPKPQPYVAESSSGPKYPPMLRGNEKLIYGTPEEEIPKDVNELEGFMDDIKSKLREEITALLNLEEEVEKEPEESVASSFYSKMYPGVHGNLFGSSDEEKRRFVPAQLLA